MKDFLIYVLTWQLLPLLVQAQNTNITTSTASTSSYLIPLPTATVLPPASTGLTVPAKIGIGIGASFGGLVIIISTALFVYHRRRWQRELQEMRMTSDTAVLNPRPPSPKPPSTIPDPAKEAPIPAPTEAELHGDEVPRTFGRSELSGGWEPPEMDAEGMMKVRDFGAPDRDVEREAGAARTASEMQSVRGGTDQRNADVTETVATNSESWVTARSVQRGDDDGG